MNQKTLVKDYLYNLKISFPDAAYSQPRHMSKQLASPAAPSFGSASSAAIADPYYMPPNAGIPPLLLHDDKEQAMIVDKSLISFVSGVNAANRADILESTLLAQLGAKAKIADESDVIGWYKSYIEILARTGRTVEGRDVPKFSAKPRVVPLHTVIIDILAAAFGANLIQIINKVLDSIKTLADSTGKIEAFEKNTHTESSGSFQIGVATQEGGAVSINLGTFLITSTNKISHILFVKFSNDETQLQYASGKLTLDQDIYGNIRSLVKQKLNGRLAEFVSDIPI